MRHPAPTDRSSPPILATDDVDLNVLQLKVGSPRDILAVRCAGHAKACAGAFLRIRLPVE
jgi:predicted nuclease of predicted toxin-antitoxin system